MKKKNGVEEVVTEGEINKMIYR